MAGDHLRPVGVIQIECGSLRKFVRRSQADGVNWISFDLDRAAHLGFDQDPRYLTAADQDIVRPFDLRLKAEPLAALHKRQGAEPCQSGREHSFQGRRPEDQAERKRRASGRMPSSTRSPAAGRLLVSHHQREITSTLRSPRERHIVGGTDALIKTKAAQWQTHQSGRDLRSIHLYWTMLQGFTLTPPSRTSKCR